MKNIFLVIVALITSLVSFSQSKKKLNEGLKMELSSKSSQYDSLISAKTKLESELKKQTRYLKEQSVFTINSLNYCRVYMDFIKKNESLLSSYNYNRDTVIGVEDVISRFSKVDKASLKVHDSIGKTSMLTATYKIDSIPKDLKIKEQNAWLLQQIDAIDSVNEINHSAYRTIEMHLALIETRKTYLKSVITDYDDLMTKLSTKLDILASICLQKVKQERDSIIAERRKEAEKELKELERLRKKKGNLVFIPPVIIDYYEDDLLMDQVIYSSKNDEVRDKLSDASEYIEIPEPTQPRSEPVIYSYTDESAEFPGGQAALKAYLLANIVLPEVVKSGEVQGKVFLKFVISSEGKVSNVSIAKGMPDCKECDEEAKRVVKAMPPWNPGKVNGKPANMWYNLPISFKAP